MSKLNEEIIHQFLVLWATRDASVMVDFIHLASVLLVFH